MVIHQHEIEIAAEKLEAGLAALAGCAVLGRDLLAFERDMGFVAVVDAQLDAILRQTDAMSPRKGRLASHGCATAFGNLARQPLDPIEIVLCGRARADHRQRVIGIDAHWRAPIGVLHRAVIARSYCRGLWPLHDGFWALGAPLPYSPTGFKSRRTNENRGLIYEPAVRARIVLLIFSARRAGRP